MENWLVVCSSHLSQITEFCRDACLDCPYLFFHGYKINTNISFGFEEDVINFSWNMGCETLPHPVAGVCPLNVTPCPRACHLILFPSLIPPFPLNMQQQSPGPPLWGRCPRNWFHFSSMSLLSNCSPADLCCWKSSCCPCSGIPPGSWCGEVVGEMGRSEVVLSSLTLLAAHWGDLLALFPGSQCRSLLFTEL